MKLNEVLWAHFSLADDTGCGDAFKNQKIIFMAAKDVEMHNLVGDRRRPTVE